MARLLARAAWGHLTDTFLIGTGVLLLAGWIGAYRLRYPYVGCLGLALLCAGVKHAGEFVPWVETGLLVIAFVAACYTGILMVAHSVSNLQKASSEIEKRREERLARLAAELKELSSQPKNPSEDRD